MSRITVLVGFAEAIAAPEVVWSLVDDGFNVVAFARKDRASALRHSRHVVCHEIHAPESDVQAALSDLGSLLASLANTSDTTQRILFPLDDSAVWLCGKVQLGPYWLLAGPRGAKAELALNKCLQTQLASEAGFAVPRTVVARTANDIFRFSTSESFPIILRPVECVSFARDRVCRRNWICDNRAELEHAVTEWAEGNPLLAQPFITGTGEGVFGLAARDGIRALSAHRRVRMMNPQGSGSSACVSQPVSPDLRTKVEELIRKADWHGLFMIELLRDHSGIAWFVELNGRPWGSMALSRRQGLEYPAWHVRLANDQESQLGLTPLSTPGVVCRNVGREIMHVLFVLRGPKSKALSSWPSFYKTIRDVIRIRRGDTFYNWRWDDPKVFAADCYYTIQNNVFNFKK